MRPHRVVLGFMFSQLLAQESDNWPCEHPIFCKPGEAGILHTVQMAGIFKDSKVFVDKPLLHPVEDILKNFETLPDRNKDTISNFVLENFSEEGTELETVTPEDWKENPAFITNIKDDNFKKLVIKMNNAWKNLTRKIGPTKEHIENFSSLIYMEHPFVVPSTGRFRELYYWDSYWTVKGLLLSEMQQTTWGMIENFKYLIDLYGHIPNGNRLYYTRRSQPPVFAQLVDNYLQSKNDLTSERIEIASVVWELDQEFKFWQTKMVNVKGHQLARYWVDVGGPRPESYKEDFYLGNKLGMNQSEVWYRHMKSGAESGWDYSSRWMEENFKSNDDELLSVKTGEILPVDLNSFLCRNAKILSNMFKEVEHFEQADHYEQIWKDLKLAIRAIFYDEEDKMWYDYNLKKGAAHNKKWYPSNLTPLYSLCHHDGLDLNDTMDIWEHSAWYNYSGGIPTSLEKTQQQWDLPNSWPPMVEIVVTALDNSKTDKGRKMARNLAEVFVQNVYSSWKKSDIIYEKYNCEEPGGGAGGGGEYEVQEGFGWTNGVTMYLLSKYPDLSSGVNMLHSTAATLSIILILFYF